MSDPAVHDEATLVVGGRGRHGFAVAAEDVGRVVGAAALPDRYRAVSLPRLFDDDVGTPGERRFAEVRGAPEATFVELGPDVRVRALPRDRIAPVPPVLRRAAARWGWRGIVRDDGGFRVLVDVAALAPLAAPRRRDAADGSPS